MLVTDDSKKVVRVPYIYYLFWFQKEQIRALLNNGSEVNAMSLAFV